MRPVQAALNAKPKAISAGIQIGAATGAGKMGTIWVSAFDCMPEAPLPCLWF
jgi:hypothetical protein